MEKFPLSLQEKKFATGLDIGEALEKRAETRATFWYTPGKRGKRPSKDTEKSDTACAAVPATLSLSDATTELFRAKHLRERRCSGFRPRTYGCFRIIFPLRGEKEKKIYCGRKLTIFSLGSSSSRIFNGELRESLPEVSWICISRNVFQLLEFRVFKL